MVNYRKIYTNHYGKIPIDIDGRSYEIHHIDGNRDNNDVSNLKAITIQEHYDIHFAQGDWGACYLIGKKMKRTPEEISELSRKIAIRRVKNGTHNWLDGTISSKTQIQRIEDGSHLFLNKEFRNKISKLAKEKIKNGTHIFQDDEFKKKLINVQKDRVKTGTHNFLGSDEQRKRAKQQVIDGTHIFLGGKIQRDTSLSRVKEGTHNFLGDSNPVHKLIEDGTFHLLGGEIQRNASKKTLENGTHPSQVERYCPHCNRIGRGPSFKVNHFDKCKKRIITN